MKDQTNPMARVNESARGPHSVSVFVASLHVEYYEFLRKEYSERPTEDRRWVVGGWRGGAGCLSETSPKVLNTL